MESQNQYSSLTTASKANLWGWAQPENVLTVLPKSKTERLTKQAKLANIDAERAMERAYQIELARTKAISEAMFKSGKALRYTLINSGRQIYLRTEAARRRLEPGYRNR